jgi:hypothetical protein
MPMLTQQPDTLFYFFKWPISHGSYVKMGLRIGYTMMLLACSEKYLSKLAQCTMVKKVYTLYITGTIAYQEHTGGVACVS